MAETINKPAVTSPPRSPECRFGCQSTLATDKLRVFTTTRLARTKAVRLPHGVMLFKNCLSEEEQIAVLDTCLEMARQGGNQFLLERKKYSARDYKAVPILFYNWPGKKKIQGIAEPTDLLTFARAMFRRAYEDFLENRRVDTAAAALVPDLAPETLLKDKAGNTVTAREMFTCPSDYNPSALYAILYPHGGHFGAHVDGAAGWVLALSIGDSADFFYSWGRYGDVTKVRLDSGDAVVFNGGQLYHGVARIYPDTAPAFWKTHEISVYDMSRFNLQFRDPERDKSGLGYDPCFSIPYTPPSRDVSPIVIAPKTTQDRNEEATSVEGAK